MVLPEPLIIINLKTYEAGSDAQAEGLVRAITSAAERYHVGAAIACQAADLFRLKDDTTLPLFCQHVDAEGYGAHTGATIIETVRCNGAVGTLLNHSEKRIPLQILKKTIERCRKLRFVSIVCAQDAREAGKIALLGPDYIAVEPPELIGGEVSVATHPHLIKNSFKAINGKAKLIVGAGVKTGEDVRVALLHGAVGVLVASHVVEARDVKKEMAELMGGAKR